MAEKERKSERRAKNIVLLSTKKIKTKVNKTREKARNITNYFYL